MKKYRQSDDDYENYLPIIYDNQSYSLNLNKKEQEIFDDLLLFNRKAEKIFFSDNYSEELLNMIDDIIENKLAGLNSWSIYKLLNNLYKNNIAQEEISPEIKIINNIKCDLAKERLGITLLSYIIDKGFAEFYNTNYMLGFENSWANNMLNFYLNGYEELNYYYMLDHVESFIGLIGSDEIINKNVKYDVINKLIFIYKDVKADLHHRYVSKEIGEILSSRYDGFSEICFGGVISITRDMISIPIFCDEAREMLKINDEVIDSSTLIVGKYYLDNILTYVSDEGFKNICEAYNEIEGATDLTNHYQAFEYIHNSINERAKEVNKEKRYELKIEVIS